MKLNGSIFVHLDSRSFPLHGAYDPDEMVRSYWAASGWDPGSGMPTSETLAELGLEELLPL